MSNYYKIKQAQLQILKEDINIFFTKKRYMGNHPKTKQAILRIVFLIIAIYIWNDIINTLKGYQIDIMVKDPEIKISRDKEIEKLIAEAKVEIKTEVVTETKVEYSIEQILDTIYVLESSSGKNDAKCECIGKHNGYGWKQGIGRNYCLNSDILVRAEVKKMIEANLAKRSIAETICGYNLGFSSENLEACMNQSKEFPYYRDFEVIINK